MANALLTPNALRDIDGNTPPVAWNGTTYAAVSAPEFFASMLLAQLAPAAGSTLTGTATVSWLDPVELNVSLYSLETFMAVESVPLVQGVATAFDFTIPDDGELYALLIGEAYGLDYSVLPSGTPTPPAPEDPFVIRGSHRAYSGTDSPQRAWIRDEAGRHDLTAYESLEVQIKQGPSDRARLTIEAAGDTQGRLQFTIPSEAAKKRLYPGTFNLYAYGDGQVIYTGLLEVLA